MIETVAVVGASLAGLQVAQTLRRAEFEGSIVMIGDEPHYPYDRPPLSKQFLAGGWDESKLRLRAAVDPGELGLEWCLGTPAVSLDRNGRQVHLADGRTVAYDRLVLACGARPRTIEGSARTGVHVLRGLDDARALRAALDAGPRRVCVIGAGFIGAEVAATARERGLEVAMIEAAEAPLVRVLDRGAGLAIAELHRSHGVDVRLGTGVVELRGRTDRDDGREGVSEEGVSEDGVSEVVLSDGSSIDADVVVIGIGVVPNTEWLAGSGLQIDDGVVCDQTLRAAPDVFACGDVARWPNPRYCRSTRVEQWDNAVDQGTYVGRRVLAGDDHPPFMPVPWFWSDQYDRKIQLAGITGPRAEIVTGSLEEQRFVQLYSDEGGTFVGALGWNRPRQAIQARQLLEQGASLDEARSRLGD